MAGKKTTLNVVLIDRNQAFSNQLQQAANIHIVKQLVTYKDSVLKMVLRGDIDIVFVNVDNEDVVLDVEKFKQTFPNTHFIAYSTALVQPDMLKQHYDDGIHLSLQPRVLQQKIDAWLQGEYLTHADRKEIINAVKILEHYGQNYESPFYEPTYEKSKDVEPAKSSTNEEVSHSSSNVNDGSSDLSTEVTHTKTSVTNITGVPTKDSDSSTEKIQETEKQSKPTVEEKTHADDHVLPPLGDSELDAKLRAIGIIESYNQSNMDLSANNNQLGSEPKKVDEATSEVVDTVAAPVESKVASSPDSATNNIESSPAHTDLTLESEEESDKNKRELTDEEVQILLQRFPDEAMNMPDVKAWVEKQAEQETKKAEELKKNAKLDDIYLGDSAPETAADGLKELDTFSRTKTTGDSEPPFEVGHEVSKPVVENSEETQEKDSLPDAQEIKQQSDESSIEKSQTTSMPGLASQTATTVSETTSKDISTSASQSAVEAASVQDTQPNIDANDDSIEVVESKRVISIKSENALPAHENPPDGIEQKKDKTLHDLDSLKGKTMQNSETTFDPFKGESDDLTNDSQNDSIKQDAPTEQGADNQNAKFDPFALPEETVTPEPEPRPVGILGKLSRLFSRKN